MEEPLAEIMAVLERHDLAGVVVVTNSIRTSYVAHLETSRGCMRIPEEGGEVRVKTTGFATKVEKRSALEHSVRNVMGLLDVLGEQSRILSGLIGQISARLHVCHVSSDKQRINVPRSNEGDG